jgi:hypothetical protein
MSQNYQCSLLWRLEIDDKSDQCYTIESMAIRVHGGPWLISKISHIAFEALTIYKRLTWWIMFGCLGSIKIPNNKITLLWSQGLGSVIKHIDLHSP